MSVDRHETVVDICSYVICFITFQRDKFQDLRIIFWVTEVHTLQFLGPFEKLQSASVGSFMSVRLTEKSQLQLYKFIMKLFICVFFFENLWRKF